MYNDLFSIGPLTVHGYGLMIGIGVIAALLLGDYRAKKKGLDGDLIYGMTVAAVVFGFIAARVLFIITEFKNFLKEPLKYITGSGFVVFGGLIGGIVAVYIYCRIKKVNAIDYMDLMAPSVALAQGFGRIGCLLAGCCYGRETASRFGIMFLHSDFAPNGVRLIPTQIIMSAGDFAIAIILLLLGLKLKKRGQITLIWLGLYSVGRFFVEFLRNDYRGSVGILSTSQFIGIFVLIGVILAYIFLVPVLNKEKAVTDSVPADESTDIGMEE